MREPALETLVLVPTELEERRLEQAGGLPEGLGTLARCGFGPVAAAARAAQLLARDRPARVLLLGLGGTFAPELTPLASAVTFSRVRIEGIGAGTGSAHLTPERLGFPQWAGDAADPVFDSLPLVGGPASLLLTVCAASGSPSEARERRRRHPEARVEDMEGFGVALACRLAGVPLVVVRGVSNVVGERDPGRWRVGAALEAARTLALEWLKRPDWSSAG